MTSGRVRRWLRLGPSRAELVAEAELWKARNERKEAERNAAHVRAKAAERQLRAAEAAIERLRAIVDAGFDEPGRETGCTKARFHRQSEAEDWAVQIAEARDEAGDAYEAYPCKVCPRSPVTMQRYWHAGHRVRGQSAIAKATSLRRRKEQETAARRAGQLVGQLVDPTVLAKLRKLREEG
jgi:hypothetical protein